MQIWSINYKLYFRYENIVFTRLYLVLVYIEKLILTACFATLLVIFVCQSIVGVGFMNYTIFFWHVEKLRQYLCLRVFIIVIYESSFPTNRIFFSIFFLVCKFSKSNLWIINLILDILKYVDSAYITGYMVLSYVKKLISTVVV